MRGAWTRTGDIGYLDQKGWLYVVDRKKGMIVKGGENIFPADAENSLYRHPKVGEAAVVGVPHKIYGEDVVPFVVLHARTAAPPVKTLPYPKLGVHRRLTTILIENSSKNERLTHHPVFLCLLSFFPKRK